MAKRFAPPGSRSTATSRAVRTKLLSKPGAEVPIEYRMLRHGDRCLVSDIVSEGVSLSGIYRTPCDTIIQTSSVQELVPRMRAQQDEAPYGEKVSTQ